MGKIDEVKHDAFQVAGGSRLRAASSRGDPRVDRQRPAGKNLRNRTGHPWRRRWSRRKRRSPAAPEVVQLRAQMLVAQIAPPRPRVCCAAPAARTPNKPNCGRRWPRSWSGKGIGERWKRSWRSRRRRWAIAPCSASFRQITWRCATGKRPKTACGSWPRTARNSRTRIACNCGAVCSKPRRRWATRSKSNSTAGRSPRKQPDNAQVRYMQFRLALDGRRSSRHGAGARRYSARRRPKRLLAVGPGDSARYAIRQAEEIRSRMLTQALKYLAKARELNGDWPPIPLAMARIYDQQGRLESGAEELPGSAGPRRPRSEHHPAGNTDSLSNAAVQRGRRAAPLARKATRAVLPRIVPDLRRSRPATAGLRPCPDDGSESRRRRLEKLPGADSGWDKC